MSPPTPREAADMMREVVDTYARESITVDDGSSEIVMVSRIDIESHEKLDHALTMLASATDLVAGGGLAAQDRRAAGSLAAAYRRGYRDAWPDIAPEPVIVVPDDLAVPTATDVGWALPLGDHPTRSEQDAPTTRDGWAALLGECIDALPGDTRTDIAVKLAKLRRVLAAAPRAEDAGPDAP